MYECVCAYTCILLQARDLAPYRSMCSYANIHIICTYIYTCIHTICTYIYTYSRQETSHHIRARASMHTYIPYVHTYIHTYIHTPGKRPRAAHTDHTYIHTYILQARDLQANHTHRPCRPKKTVAPDGRSRLAGGAERSAHARRHCRAHRRPRTQSPKPGHRAREGAPIRPARLECGAAIVGPRIRGHQPRLPGACRAARLPRPGK